MDIKIVNENNVSITYGDWFEINFKYSNTLTMLDEVLKSIVDDNKLQREICLYKHEDTRTLLTFDYDGEVDHSYLTIHYILEVKGNKIYDVDINMYTAEFVCICCDVLGYERDDYF